MEPSRRPADAPPLPDAPPPATPPAAGPPPAGPPPVVAVVDDVSLPPADPPPVGGGRPVVAVVDDVAPVSTVPALVQEPSPVLSATPGAPAVAPETRMLPPHQTKTERVADHVAAISADLREWTELRIALVKRQIEGVVGILERLQHLADAAKLAIPGALLVILAALLFVITLALGIGALIGSTWGGFAIVATLLLVIGGVLVWLGKKRYDQAQEEVAEAKRAERSQRTMTREQIEEEQRRSATLSAS